MDVCDNSNTDERKKQLFLSQVDTLNIFLANGAITREQYDISFSGLVTKMNISREQLKAWSVSR